VTLMMIDPHKHLSKKQQDTFYPAFRGACRPPMVKLASLEVGELWFYDGLCLTVIACVGDKSLLVAYDPDRTRRKVEAQFRAAYAWLFGKRPNPPDDLHLVFAAREKRSGNLLVRRCIPGDWAGIPGCVPLEPSRRKHPVGWRPRK